MTSLREKILTRPVKHPRLWKWTHVIAPVAFGGWILWLADMQVCHLVDSGPWWTCVFFVAFTLAAACWGVVTVRPFLKERAYRLYSVDVQLLEVTDKGEMHELGDGWRRVKLDTVITEGRGRLARPQMQWIELALHTETREHKVIAVSDERLNDRIDDLRK